MKCMFLKIILSFENSKDPNLSQIKTLLQKEPLRAIMKLFFSQYPPYITPY